MFSKFIMIVLGIVVGAATPVAHASTRINAPLEMVMVDVSADEIRCLEAFTGSKFSYAHRLCLSLARKGMAKAQLVTGLMYALGEGTVKNSDLARLWLQEALRNGSGDAKEALIDFKLVD